jgi:hypothetical protein
MSRKNGLVGKWIVIYGEFSASGISQVLEQVGPNIFLTKIEHFSTNESSEMVRGGAEFGGVTVYATREECLRAAERKRVN